MTLRGVLPSWPKQNVPSAFTNPVHASDLDLFVSALLGLKGLLEIAMNVGNSTTLSKPQLPILTYLKYAQLSEKRLEQPLPECKKPLIRRQKPGFFRCNCHCAGGQHETSCFTEVIYIAKLRESVRENNAAATLQEKTGRQRLQTLPAFSQLAIYSPDSRVRRRPAHRLSLCRSFE